MAELPECIEIETGAAPVASVIWLHGLGADGNDFVPIIDEMILPSAPIRFVFPHAPMRPVTINGGYVMRAWYDIATVDLVRREDESGVRASANQVGTLIEREAARGVAHRKIVLAGFSQGGAIALFAGLRYPQRLAGIMALSTYLPLAEAVRAECAGANSDIPIFMAHGTVDPVVALERAESARAALTDMGFAPQWRTYAMPHSVCAEEIADLSKWLTGVLV